MSAATTDACLGILEREGLREVVMDSLMTAICSHISRRVSGKYKIHVLVFSNVYGILGFRTV
jgi:cobalt-precorrin-5B (C1)-methyltransferase